MLPLGCRDVVSKKLWRMDEPTVTDKSADSCWDKLCSEIGTSSMLDIRDCVEASIREALAEFETKQYTKVWGLGVQDALTPAGWEMLRKRTAVGGGEWGSHGDQIPVTHGTADLDQRDSSGTVSGVTQNFPTTYTEPAAAPPERRLETIGIVGVFPTRDSLHLHPKVAWYRSLEEGDKLVRLADAEARIAEAGFREARTGAMLQAEAIEMRAQEPVAWRYRAGPQYAWGVSDLNPDKWEEPSRFEIVPLIPKKEPRP